MVNQNNKAVCGEDQITTRGQSKTVRSKEVGFINKAWLFGPTTR